MSSREIEERAYSPNGKRLAFADLTFTSTPARRRVVVIDLKTHRTVALPRRSAGLRLKAPAPLRHRDTKRLTSPATSRRPRRSSGYGRRPPNHGRASRECSSWAAWRRPDDRERRRATGGPVAAEHRSGSGRAAP